MKIIVCGGRDFDDRKTVVQYLDGLNPAPTHVVHGDARGADRLARDWAIARGIEHTAYPADWDRHRNAAGPIRNRVMADESGAELVVAFPGGRGTADMIAVARERKIPVRDVGRELGLSYEPKVARPPRVASRRRDRDMGM